MNNYPYPVLNEDSNSYVEEKQFRISILEYGVSEGLLNVKIGIELNSEYLIGLIQQEKAKMVFKVSNDILIQTFDFTDYRSEVLIKIPIKSILRIDTIVLCCFVISNCDFIIEYNEEFSDLFGDDFSFNITQHMVLAESNSEVLNYNLNNPDIIKLILSSEQEGKGLLFSCGKEHIDIKAGNDFIAAYKTIVQKPGMKILANNLLVFNALLYGFLEVISSEDDEYNNSSWYKIISQGFINGDQTFDDFISEMKDDLDPRELFISIQKFMHNSLEEGTIKAAEMGK